MNVIEKYKANFFFNKNIFRNEIIENFENEANYDSNSKDAALPNCYIKGGETEWGERIIANKYTNRCTSILEFGGGSGSVSTIIQQNLKNKRNHIVIQPANNGHGVERLLANKKSCNSQFTLIDHVVEKGEGNKILNILDYPPDCIVADCEGCLHLEYEKNPELFNNVKMIQVERDDGRKYDNLFQKLQLRKIDDGKGLGCDGRCDTQVWVK